MKKENIIKYMLILMTLLPAVSFAHTGDDGSGFLAGLKHPIFGWDHLLAMLCVGVVSAQLGGRHIWTIPSLFVVSMVIGGVIGANGISFPFIEMNIALSVIVLGLVIVFFKKTFNISLIMLFVAFFGASHGYAHGVEMPNSASPVFYSFGFVVSTSTIHLIGVGIGHYLSVNSSLQRGLTVFGASVSVAGCFLLFNLVGAA